MNAKTKRLWMIPVFMLLMLLAMALLYALTPPVGADYGDGMECPVCGKWRWDDYVACYDCGTCEDCIDADSHFCSDCECCIAVDGGEFCFGCWRCEDCNDGTACPDCQGSCVKCETNGISCSGCWLCGSCNDDTVCPDCGESCVKCESGGPPCSGCWRCEGCNGASVCPDCGETCLECQSKEQCENCLTCVDCAGQVCEGCYQTCSSCNNIAMCTNCSLCDDCSGGVCGDCEDRCMNCDSEMCEGCGTCSDCNGGTTCPDCHGTCYECENADQCENCFTCADCATICSDCQKVCSECDDNFCLDCETCSDCNGDTACPDCHESCANCAAKPQCQDCWLCEDCTIICEDCGAICADCDGEFCLGCNNCSSCSGGTVCPDCYETCLDCNSRAQCRDCYLCEDCAVVCEDCGEICEFCGSDGWCQGCETCGDCNGDTACPDCHGTCAACKTLDQCRECFLCEDCVEVCRNCGDICADCDSGFNSTLRLCSACDGDPEVPRLAIVRQPASAVVVSGGEASFAVEAVGDGLTYEWFAHWGTASDFEKVNGASGPTLTVSNVTQDGTVFCRVKDKDGNIVKSDWASVFVQSKKIVLTGLGLPVPGQPFDFTAPASNVGTVEKVVYLLNREAQTGTVKPNTTYQIAFYFSGADEVLGQARGRFTPLVEWNGLTPNEEVGALLVSGRYVVAFDYTTPARADIEFTGTALPVPGQPLDTTLPTAAYSKTGNSVKATGIVWRVNGKETTGNALPNTTYKVGIVLPRYYENPDKMKAVWNGIEASMITTVEGRGTVFEFAYTTPAGGSSGSGGFDYSLDLSGASVNASGVSGTGRLVKSDGGKPDGKKYVYIVVNYERADGSTWAVAGTYSVDSDGEFDIPSITGVSDKVSGVLVIAVDSKTGASWAGHNITKPQKISP